MPISPAAHIPWDLHHFPDLQSPLGTNHKNSSSRSIPPGSPTKIKVIYSQSSWLLSYIIQSSYFSALGLKKIGTGSNGELHASFSFLHHSLFKSFPAAPGNAQIYRMHKETVTQMSISSSKTPL